MEFLENEKILYQKQFGFRKCHQTIHAVLDLLNEVAANKENKSCTLTVFCDLRKAFDVVRHDILLAKLMYYGLQDTELGWFESYLSKRTQRVMIRGTMSRGQIIKTADKFRIKHFRR